MKEGFFFGLGMMIGLLTPSVVFFIVLGITVGLRDLILSRRKKRREAGLEGSEPSKVLVFQTEPRAHQTERTNYSRGVTL